MASRLKGSETPELAGAEQPLGISVFRVGTERLVPPSGGSKADFHLGGGSAVHEAFLPDDRKLLNGDVAGDGVHIQQTGAVRLAFRDAVDVAGNRVAADLGPNAFRKLHVHVAAGAFERESAGKGPSTVRSPLMELISVSGHCPSQRTSPLVLVIRACWRTVSPSSVRLPLVVLRST